MYSIVLLAAMTSGADAPACHKGGCGGGGHGCVGGGHGCFGGLFKGHGHRHGNGCCGAPSCCEAPAPACGCCGAPAPVAACGCCGGEAKVEEKDDADEGEGEEKESKANAPAKLIVTIPAQATLTIDGAVTKSVAARRVFVSPMLTVGKVYTYTLQAEINEQTVTKTVDVRAGETTTVVLTAASVASR